jgi:hypothetical protein
MNQGQVVPEKITSQASHRGVAWIGWSEEKFRSDLIEHHTTQFDYFLRKNKTYVLLGGILVPKLCLIIKLHHGNKINIEKRTKPAQLPYF